MSEENSLNQESVSNTSDVHSGPMHQFEVHTIHGGDLKILGIDISITNAVLTMFGVVALLIVAMSSLLTTLRVIPTKKQALAEMMYNFITSLINNNIQDGGKKFTPLIFSLFFFIFCSNAFGLLPYAFTVTSHVAVTASLAAIIFLLNMTIGMVKNGPVGFFLSLIPHGVPKAFIPLIFVIELFAYLARPVTLAVRLAVNMVAGHIMMKVIAGFVLYMGLFGIIPILFNSMLTGFEFFVAGLQAYIFSMLTCIYINGALHHH